MSSTQIFASAVTVIFPMVMIFAGIMDLMTLKIRNKLVIGVAIAYFICALLIGLGLYEILLSVGIAALVLVVSFGFFAAGWIGGGDAKLAAATALWFGTGQILPYLLASTLIGGLLTLVVIGYRSMLLPPSFYGHAWLVRLHESKTGVPYGVAFAIAALIIFPDTVWFEALH